MRRLAAFSLFVVILSLGCNFVTQATPTPTPIPPTPTAIRKLPFDPSELRDKGIELCEQSGLSNWMTDASLVGAHLSSLDYEWDYETGSGWLTVNIYPLPTVDGYFINFEHHTVTKDLHEVSGPEAERILTLASEKLGGVTHLRAKFEMRTEGNFLLTTSSCSAIKD